MTKYSLGVNPYSLGFQPADSQILINRFLISNQCIEVTRKEWEETWYRDGWRPVEIYGLSSETDFEVGDLVWSRALGISNYREGEPRWVFKKVIMRPSDFPKMTAERITKLLALGETLELNQLLKPAKIKL